MQRFQSALKILKLTLHARENEHVFKCGRCSMFFGILTAPLTSSSGHRTMISPGTSGGLLCCHRK